MIDYKKVVDGNNELLAEIRHITFADEADNKVPPGKKISDRSRV